jgi:hypothetical protein
MVENFRRFQAGPDPFGRTWEMEYRWLQTGISIRHADTVDVKFIVWMNAPDGAHLEESEKVIAMPHPALLTLAAESGHALTDPWCARLAARHLVRCFESGEDMEKTLITAPLAALRAVVGTSKAA